MTTQCVRSSPTMSDAKQANISTTLASLNVNYPLKYLWTETYQAFLKIKQHSTATSPARHEGPWFQVLKQRDVGNILQPGIDQSHIQIMMLNLPLNSHRGSRCRNKRRSWWCCWHWCICWERCLSAVLTATNGIHCLKEQLHGVNTSNHGRSQNSLILNMPFLWYFW